MRVGAVGCRCHPRTPVPCAQHLSQLLGGAVGRWGGTHQQTSMATRPASRMAKRTERMEVRAIMPALRPLPMVAMLLGGWAGERAAGDGRERDVHPGARCARGQSQRALAVCKRSMQTQYATVVCKRTVRTPRATARCHHTPAGPAAAPCLSFPDCSQERCTPNLWYSVCSPPPWDHPVPPAPMAVGLCEGQDEHPGSGTCSQGDGVRPGCLSHRLGVVQGEELHPGVGREVGHAAPSRGGYRRAPWGHVPMSRLTGMDRVRAGGRCRWVSCYPWHSWSRCRRAAP